MNALDNTVPPGTGVGIGIGEVAEASNKTTSGATSETTSEPTSARKAAPIGRQDLLALSTRSNGQALVRAGTHFGAVIVVGLGIWYMGSRYSALCALPLIVLQAYLVAFLFTAVHECAHKTAFRSRALNLITGHDAGAAIALPYGYYCLFHWDHHRYTQDPERDPELLFARVVPGSAPQLALWFSGVIQLALRIRLLFRHAITGKVTAPWVPEAKRALIVREARVYVGTYTVLFLLSCLLHTSALFWAWVLPLFLGQIVLRPYLLAEHTGCSETRSAFDNTRTTYTNAFVHWFAWNMPYHVEHHAYPSVPFHALAELNKIVGSHARFRGEDGYLAVTASNWQWFRRIGQARQRQQ